MTIDCGRCRVCDGEGWTCENHPDRPWDGTSSRDDACGCGAGAPCAVCNEAMANAALHADCAKWRELAEGLHSQFDWQGCTCTFPSNDCCSFAKYEAFALTDIAPEQPR